MASILKIQTKSGRRFRQVRDMSNEELLAELEQLNFEITSGHGAEKLGERYREVRVRILAQMNR